MMKEMLEIATRSPATILEDVIGVSALFIMVFVTLQFPLLV